MKIVQTYSHLNGLEFLLVHYEDIWKELLNIIGDIDANICKIKESKEKNKIGQLLYSPKQLNIEFKKRLEKENWSESKTFYYITTNIQLARATLTLKPEEQKKIIVDAGEIPYYAYNQTDFVKDRIAIEVQFGKYAFVAYDLFVKHMAFYIGNKIDVGIEILPMKNMQKYMSTGIGYYEGELYNVVRQGRNSPAVPLVLIGIEP